ncbi:MAG: nitrous oxide reductase family maturation protein NosD [Flavobacteriales bacterium]
MSSVFSRTIEVCATCEATDLVKALELAIDDDRILVKKGIHLASEVIVEKAVEITGEPGAVLDGQGKTILYVHHDSVTIRDIELRNVETNYVEDRAALKCNNSDYLNINNIKVRQSFFGILLENSKHGLIQSCDIQGEANEQNYLESSNGNAIHLWYCKHMKIINNTVKQHRDGIYFEFVENSTIRGNHSQGNMRYGLHFMFSHHNDYQQNVFTENGAGVAVMYSDHVTMTENQFIDNWGGSAYGLLLKDIKDSKLENNIFKENTIAISADNSVRIEIKNNRFVRNGYALRIMGNCTDNIIQENDFAENSFDVTTNAKSNFNDFTGNYWEEYTGYDLDRDGVGDVPFRPVKLFTYIIAQSPASIILMRSTFIDLLNLAEKVTPVITPETLVDNQPKMKPINDHLKFGF